MGLCNAPSIFQATMDKAFNELRFTCVKVYVDDILVHTDGPTEFSAIDSHVDDLEAMFKRTDCYNLRLQPKKCILFQRQVRHLGYLLSAKGGEPTRGMWKEF